MSRQVCSPLWQLSSLNICNNSSGGGTLLQCHTGDISWCWGLLPHQYMDYFVLVLLRENERKKRSAIYNFMFISVVTGHDIRYLP